MIAIAIALRGVAARLPLFAVGVLLSAALGGFSPAIAQEQPRLRIAIALPLTGPFARLGHEIKSAIEVMAAYEPMPATQRAPIVSWHDDHCSTAGGASAANALTAAPLAERPHVVIGHACPSAADAAEPIYSAAKMTFISAGRLQGNASPRRRNSETSFRLPAAGEQGAAIAAGLANLPPTARIGFVRDRTKFAIQTMGLVQSQLVRRGTSAAVLETFNGGDRDFTKQVARLKEAGVTHIAVAAYASEASLLVRDLRAELGDIPIIATDTLADVSFARVAGAAAHGVQIALAPDIRAFPSAQAFASRYKAATGTEPYRAALAAAAAYQIIARLSPSSLPAVIKSAPHATILGTVAFDANGDANVPAHVLYVWRGGELMPPAAR